MKPHLVRSFKLSTDPRFVEKLIDAVGLYMNPPEHAPGARPRRARFRSSTAPGPGLPLKKGRVATMSRDYKRNGKAALFATLNLPDGTVVGQVHLRDCYQEFLRFLFRLDREYPADLDLHLVLDNYVTHGHPKVKALCVGESGTERLLTRDHAASPPA